MSHLSLIQTVVSRKRGFLSEVPNVCSSLLKGSTLFTDLQKEVVDVRLNWCERTSRCLQTACAALDA